jgi:hypothetical protein
LNTKSNTLFPVSQVKQKQQDLKKEYYNLNDLLAGSGFGWDNHFPYFDALAPLHYGELCIVLIISAFV